jgi:hypothetical protein
LAASRGEIAGSRQPPLDELSGRHPWMSSPAAASARAPRLLPLHCQVAAAAADIPANLKRLLITLSSSSVLVAVTDTLSTSKLNACCCIPVKQYHKIKEPNKEPNKVYILNIFTHPR